MEDVRQTERMKKKMEDKEGKGERGEEGNRCVEEEPRNGRR